MFTINSKDSMLTIHTNANTYLRHDLADNMVAYMTSDGMVIKPITESKKYRPNTKCLNGKCSAYSGW